ncbi:MAG: hypothetical protein AB7Y46_06680 [Armatimonadota bacterium]
MPLGPWLELDDQLLLDGEDCRVTARLVGRADRLTFQRLTVRPQLGGEAQTLLQLEDAVLQAQAIAPEELAGETALLEGRVFALRWEGDVRIERGAVDARTTFWRGRCRWFEAADGSVAVLIDERHDRDALLGVPMAPGRIDLSFTEGLRRGGRG